MFGVALRVAVARAAVHHPATSRRHDLLDRPRDNPRRTAFGAAFFTWVSTIFIAGSADRLFVAGDVPYDRQVWIFRAGAFVFPVIAYVATYRAARRLQRTTAQGLG